jgi:hypothetical protein
MYRGHRPPPPPQHHCMQRHGAAASLPRLPEHFVHQPTRCKRSGKLRLAFV